MTEGTPAASNDAMVRAFFAAWERRDTPYIMDCFTDDAVYHSIPLTPIVGKDGDPGRSSRISPDVPTGPLGDPPPVASADVVMNERTDHITLNGYARRPPHLRRVRDRGRSHQGVARILRSLSCQSRLRHQLTPHRSAVDYGVCVGEPERVRDPFLRDMAIPTTAPTTTPPGTNTSRGSDDAVARPAPRRPTPAVIPQTRPMATPSAIDAASRLVRIQRAQRSTRVPRPVLRP